MAASWSTQTVPGDPCTWQSETPVQRVRVRVHLTQAFGGGALIGAALVLLGQRVREQRDESGQFLRSGVSHRRTVGPPRRRLSSVA